MDQHYCANITDCCPCTFNFEYLFPRSRNYDQFSIGTKNRRRTAHYRNIAVFTCLPPYWMDLVNHLGSLDPTEVTLKLLNCL